MTFKKKSEEQNNNLRSQESQIKKTVEQTVDTKSNRQFNHSTQETSNNVQETSRTQKQSFKQENTNVQNFGENKATQSNSNNGNLNLQNEFQEQGNTNIQHSNNYNFSTSNETSSRTQKKIRSEFQEQEHEQASYQEHEQEIQQERIRQENETNNQLSHTEDLFNQTFSQDTPINNMGVSNAGGYVNRNTKSPTSSVIGKSTNSNSKLTKQYDNQTEQTKEQFTKKQSSTRKLEKQFESTDSNQLKHSSSVINRTGTNISTDKNKSNTSRFRLNKGSQTTVSPTDTNNTTSSAKNKQVKSQRMKLSRDKLKNGVKGTVVATGSVTGASLSKGTTAMKREFEKSEEIGVVGTSQVVGATAATTKKVVGKLQVKKAEKLKDKKLDKLKEKKGNKHLKKGRENPLSKEKKSTSSLKKVMTTPVQTLKSGGIKSATKYTDKLTEEDDGIKIAKEGSVALARASKKLSKGTIKATKSVSKLNKDRVTKLKERHEKKLKVDIQKKKLQKKAVRKKMRTKKGAKGSKTVKGIKDKLLKALSKLKKISFKNIGRAIASKLAIGAASSLSGILLPVGAIVLFVFLAVAILGAVTSPQYEETNVSIGTSKNLSPSVERWRELVTKEANAQGMGDYVDLLLALIQVESGGTGTADIMQSSESAGYDRPNVWSTPEQSVRQGVKHLKDIVNIAKGYGGEGNPKLLAQAYNFGRYFAIFVGKNGGSYTLDVAEKYSRDVVAPSLFNTTGRTYPYVNDLSTSLGKPYLYTNGGNYMYGEMVAQYLGGGAGANIAGEFGAVLKDLERFQGWPYSWGGKNPQQGFDCSGLTTWGLAQMGINIPSYTVSQWDMTYPVSAKDARPGDLVFFKGTYGGPNFVSHVGFYIDANTMYDSSSSGIGYKDLRDPYWQKHFAGIRRVKGK